MGKLFGALFFTILCLVFALIPEIGMYFTWNLIHPESEFARVVMIGIFWFGGAGLCIFFGFLGFVAWVHGIVAILE